MIMIAIAFVLILRVLAISSDESERVAEKCVFSCRSTDFACFQKQYKHLRDHVVLGCKELDIPAYKQYYFQYSDTNTCVRVSGVEASKLIGISFDGANKLFTLMISMPVRFQQGWPNWTVPCKPPEKEFSAKGPHEGPYKKFAGNGLAGDLDQLVQAFEAKSYLATIIVQLPFTLEKKNDQFYIAIEDEDLDVTLDVPDLSNYNKLSQLETRIYEWSEWAYEMVQHVDVPEHVMLPYLRLLKQVYNKLPLERFILLYPSEQYSELGFKYVESNVVP